VCKSMYDSETNPRTRTYLPLITYVNDASQTAGANKLVTKAPKVRAFYLLPSRFSTYPYIHIINSAGTGWIPISYRNRKVCSISYTFCTQSLSFPPTIS